MKKSMLTIAAALATIAPAMAHDAVPMVSAKDPVSLLNALANAGYDVELGTDSVGDPQLTLPLAGFNTGIFFYGCDEEKHDQCTSLQFTTGFDRVEPITSDLALQISQTYRYAAIQVDNEGDPFVTWDVYTGDGIPMPVFLASVREYERTLDDASEMVFADESAVQGN